MKLYVGCGLTHAPQEYIDSITELKKELQKNYEVLEFLGLHKGTDAEVYENDTNCVKTCDLFIAECSHPSIGLGYELGIALSNNKPVLAVARHDVKVTRLVLGINHPGFTFVRYETTGDILIAVEEKIKAFVAP